MDFIRYFLITTLFLITNQAFAEDGTYNITFNESRFEPQRLKIPANKKITLNVKNLSNEAIEFESFKLNREKVIAPNEAINIYLPELSSGTYDFYDDFHNNVVEGQIVVE